MITFQVYSLNDFQVSSTVLIIIIVTMLSIRSSELIHLIVQNLCTLTNISPSTPLLILWKSPFLIFIFVSLALKKKILYISENRKVFVFL